MLRDHYLAQLVSWCSLRVATTRSQVPSLGLLVARIINLVPRGTTSCGSAVVNGGAPQLTAAVDRRWPPLTATVDRCSGGGSSDSAGTVKMPRGTTQVVTRGHLIIWYEVLFIVCKSEVWSPRQSLVYEVRRSRVLEVDVARCDWWIQLQTAGGYEV
ncbi:hypothetical protein Tco_1280347 [Tanacetum coccineum]